jgi:hypothetical protein
VSAHLAETPAAAFSGSIPIRVQNKMIDRGGYRPERGAVFVFTLNWFYQLSVKNGKDEFIIHFVLIMRICAVNR